MGEADRYQRILAKALATVDDVLRKADIRAQSPVHLLPPSRTPLPKNTVVAIVDDDESVREALAALIRSLGYRALSFAGPQDLLRSRRRHGLACLIVDVQMPGMTGPELHQRLVESGERIPTILITAYPDERMRARALSAGVICCLVKPFDEADLLACLRSALKHPEPPASP